MAGAHGVAILFLACALAAARAQIASGPGIAPGVIVRTLPAPPKSVPSTPTGAVLTGGPSASGLVDGFANPFGKAGDRVVPVGGCGYDALDGREYPFYNVMLVAEDSALVAGKTLGGCGSCYEIQCADTVERCKNGPLSTSIIATVGGTCDVGCDDVDFNLHAGGFSQLAGARGGGIQIRIKEAPCVPEGNVVLNVEQYRPTDGGYIKFSVRNIPGDGGLTSVEIQGSDEVNGWFEAENTFGAVWEASVLPVPPMDIRLTNTKGEQLVLKKIITVPGFVGEAQSSEQFGGSSFPPKTPPPPSQSSPIPIPGSEPPTSPVPTPSPTSPAPPPPSPTSTSLPVPSLPTPSLLPPSIGTTSSTPSPTSSSFPSPSPSPSTGGPPRRSPAATSSPLPAAGSAAANLLDSQP